MTPETISFIKQFVLEYGPLSLGWVWGYMLWRQKNALDERLSKAMTVLSLNILVLTERLAPDQSPKLIHHLQNPVKD